MPRKLRALSLAIVFSVVLAHISPRIAGAEKITLPATTTVEVNSCPGQDVTRALLARIDGAQKSILVLAYGFRHPDIAEALIRAHVRGVQVQIVVDRRNNTGRNARYSCAGECIEAGIPVSYDGSHPIAHNKVLIVDGRTVATGSFNFTKSAEKNAENSLIIDSADLARWYIDDFADHLAHAQP